MFDLSIIGCGYLGCALAENLMPDGIHIAGSTTSESGYQKLKSLNIQPIRLIIDSEFSRDQDVLGEILNTKDLLISFPPPRNKEQYSDYYAALGTLALAINESPVQQVIFISSTGIYPGINREVDEFTDLNRLEGRSEMLRNAEHSLKNQINKPLTILRLAGLVGPGRHPGRFLTGRKDLDNAMVPVNLVHVGDCVEAIKLVFSKAPLSATYNVVADEHPNREVFYTMASKSLGLPPPTFSDTVVGKWKQVSNNLIRAQLGFEFGFPILPKKS